MAKSKYKIWKRLASYDGSAVQTLYEKIKQTLINKYFNIWMNKFEFEGLDEEVKEQQENYIMRKFWSDGTIAGRMEHRSNMSVFCPWTTVKINLYDIPEIIRLVNVRNAPKVLIPDKDQIVNKDATIIYAQPNHKPISEVIIYYIDRIAQVEMVINTRLQTEKLPYLIAVDELDKKRMEDIVQKILNNELVVFSDINSLQKIQVASTNAPYIIDKLKQYQVALENEVLTYLGVDNSGVQQKKAQMVVDEVNSNNDMINEYGQAIEDEINRGFEQFNRMTGKNISVKSKSVAIDTTQDYEDASIIETKENSENE